MRLCTWNILLGLRLGAVLNAVTSLPDFGGLDLLALQEASTHDGRPDAAVIAEAMGGDYCHFQAYAQRFRGLDQGNALIWRRGLFEEGSPRVISLSEIPTENMSRAERVLLRAIPPQKRICLRAESPHMRVYVMHLDVVGFAYKIEQFRLILSDMESRPAVPLTLVAGDLNTIGPPRLQLWRKLHAEARAAGLVELTSNLRRTHWTAQKLDAIFAQADEAPAHRAWTLRVGGSDHLPVFAELAC